MRADDAGLEAEVPTYGQQLSGDREHERDGDRRDQSKRGNEQGLHGTNVSLPDAAP